VAGRVSYPHGRAPAARVSCGSGQQHPFRAPQRVQRIALEIVSSGVSKSSRCRRANLSGSTMMLCRQSSQCSQARLPSLTSIARWARFQASSLGT
jgi:hypothetical protein